MHQRQGMERLGRGKERKLLRQSKRAPVDQREEGFMVEMLSDQISTKYSEVGHLQISKHTAKILLARSATHPQWCHCLSTGSCCSRQDREHFRTSVAFTSRSGHLLFICFARRPASEGLDKGEIHSNGETEGEICQSLIRQSQRPGAIGRLR